MRPNRSEYVTFTCAQAPRRVTVRAPRVTLGDVFARIARIAAIVALAAFAASFV